MVDDRKPDDSYVRLEHIEELLKGMPKIILDLLLNIEIKQSEKTKFPKNTTLGEIFYDYQNKSLKENSGKDGLSYLSEGNSDEK